MPQKQKSNRLSAQEREDSQSVGLVALMIGFGIAYLGAELVLINQPHPGHWLVAGVVAAIVGTLGYGLTLWRLTRR